MTPTATAMTRPRRRRSPVKADASAAGRSDPAGLTPIGTSHDRQISHFFVNADGKETTMTAP